MNFLYAINFAPGFEELVSSFLTELTAEVLKSEEGFILTQFKNKPEMAKLRFAKGVVEVFDWSDDFKALKLEIPDDFEIEPGKRFNLRSFEAGKPSKVDPELREQIIRAISKKTGLIYSSFEPEVDFVLMQRRDGLSYFGVKLADEASFKAQKGEIQSDVANLLLKLGDLKIGGIILDAFAGQAGISKEILVSFEPKQLVLSEKESRLVNILKKDFKEEPKLKVVAADAVNFLKNDSMSFDLIVADPPWGEFMVVNNLQGLYEDFLVRAESRIHEQGRIVIMSSAKDELKQAVKKTELKILAELNVLISGKKVLVLKLGK